MDCLSSERLELRYMMTSSVRESRPPLADIARECKLSER